MANCGECGVGSQTCVECCWHSVSVESYDRDKRYVHKCWRSPGVPDERDRSQHKDYAPPACCERFVEKRGGK